MQCPNKNIDRPLVWFPPGWVAPLPSCIPSDWLWTTDEWFPGQSQTDWSEKRWSSYRTRSFDSGNSYTGLDDHWPTVFVLCITKLRIFINDNKLNNLSRIPWRSYQVACTGSTCPCDRSPPALSRRLVLWQQTYLIILVFEEQVFNLFFFK